MHSSPSSFHILKQVDSTNNYAMAKVHAGMAKHGDAWFSDCQTGGRGQRGKQWHTGKGENIAVSIVIEPARLNISQQFRLSAAVALGCFDFFSALAGDETSIKWPNDIYWCDRKAGGILIENLVGTESSGKNREKDLSNTPVWKYAVAGIGLNINQPSFQELSAAVSLKQITGNSFDLVVLARELHLAVLGRVAEVLAGAFKPLLQEYNTHLYKKEKAVKLKKGNIEFDTWIKGVTETGQLFTTDRIDNYFNFGEVEWIK